MFAFAILSSWIFSSFYKRKRETKSSAPHKFGGNDALATYRKFLEPFLHFSINNVALLVHQLGKFHIDVAKRLEDASARVERITWI